MIALLGRVPLLVWVILAVVLAFAAQEWRMAALRAEMQEAREAAFQEAIVEIHTQRAAAEQERATLGAERAALQKDVEANRKALAALASRSTVAGEATARDLVAAKALVAHPSWDALQAAAGRLGVAIKPVVR